MVVVARKGTSPGAVAPTCRGHTKAPATFREGCLFTLLKKLYPKNEMMSSNCSASQLPITLPAAVVAIVPASSFIQEDLLLTLFGVLRDGRVMLFLSFIIGWLTKSEETKGGNYVQLQFDT